VNDTEGTTPRGAPGCTCGTPPFAPPEPSNDCPFHRPIRGRVAEYEVTRHYGGPGEGGWWYDRYKYIKTIFEFFNEERAVIAARVLNTEAKAMKRAPSGNYQGRFSVGGYTDQVFMTEQTEKQHDNMDEPRPHYE